MALGDIAQSYLAGLQAPEVNQSNAKFIDALLARSNAMFQNQLAFQRQSQLQGNRLENQKALQRFKVEQQGDLIGQLFGNGNVPPGTTMNVAGFNVPLNPKLTSDEAAAVAAQQVFAPLGEAIQQQTREGVFQSPFGNVGRTYRQFAAGQTGRGSGLLTAYDSRLQALQGHIKSIQRYVFGEGGKQLTGTERDIVMALIDPTGKSDDQYITDVGEATKLITVKSGIALGGAQAARQPVNPFRPKRQQLQTSSQISPIINVRGRRFRILDNSNPNDPDVEEL